MPLIVDRNLRQLIAAAPAVHPKQGRVAPLASATSIEVGKWNSKIQPASLDLTIGRILLPIDDTSDEAVHAETSLSLDQGETAVVETHEYLSMPRTLAAIGFPPANVSRAGLLMTNPGHIDPGFSGRLKFTVINLGKKPIQLVSGHPICTLLFFAIDAPDFAYDQLDSTEKPEAPSERSLLATLSKDFLNVNERIQDRVTASLWKAQFGLPIIGALSAVILTIITSITASWLSGVSELRTKVEGLEKSLSVKDLTARIEKLEQKK
ncbi:dCTP deaminase [Bradyrhizobium sp. HKCCYLR20261]|uniref:dCTP deaminase n=1 Tax=Bradyrhizobium sp. HKCCYLR20261 TaxID=3420760 RepID=UPI003EBD84D2